MPKDEPAPLFPLAVQRVVALLLLAIGIGLLLHAVYQDRQWDSPGVWMGGILTLGIGGIVVGRSIVTFLKVGKEGVSVEFPTSAARADVPSKTLPPQQLKQREQYAIQHPPPASDAPEYDSVADIPDIGVIPGADATVPMYVLDKYFRIIDWNDAFSLAFDRTMEGRRGQGALEWVYFLDNFEQVLEHGRTTFSDPANLPNFDIETIRYTGVRYGALTATKRAFKFWDDSGEYAGWVIILELSFAEPSKQELFFSEMLSALEDRLWWSKYAVSYDKVLMNSPLYLDLLDLIAGDGQRLAEIKAGARVLDLGAGTGNIAKHLAERGCTVYALENNRTMLNLIRQKCNGLLTKDEDKAGILLLKQDVRSLFGLRDDYFDYVIANHVLYTLDDARSCVSEIVRVLKPGGEVRVSGPRKGFDIDRLFASLKKGLQDKGKLEEVKEHFQNAYEINKKILEPHLRQWSETDIMTMLKEADLEITVPDISYYDNNGQLTVACKKAGTSSSH